MDITATFLGVCKARKALDKNVAALTPGAPQKAKLKLLPKPPVTDFQKNALELLSLVAKVRDHILTSRKDYLEHDSQSRRHDIENEIVLQLRSCTAGLSQLRQDVHHNRTQIKTHRAAIVEILSAFIAGVSKMFADQQAIRVKRELDHARMLKLESAFRPKTQLRPEELEKRPVVRKPVSDDQRAVILEEEHRVSAFVPADAFSLQERQMFENENADLFEELSGMEDDVKFWLLAFEKFTRAVAKKISLFLARLDSFPSSRWRRIENQLTEISKLQQVFTENILVQEHQIDDVAATAVSATENVKAGNIDIREAIQKTASFRAWILFVVLVLSFTLLFLDWYNE